MTNSAISFEELPRVASELQTELKEIKETMQTLVLLVKKSNEATSEEIIGIEEACRILGLRKPTVYHKVQRGEIPTCRPSGCKKLMFKRGELITWLSQQKHSVATTAEIYAEMQNSVRRKPKSGWGGM